MGHAKLNHQEINTVFLFSYSLEHTQCAFLRSSRRQLELGVPTSRRNSSCREAAKFFRWRKIIAFLKKAHKSALGWLAGISTPRLKWLPILHLEPINVVVFNEPITPNLGVGFALRCFQRLSLPYIATRRFTWWQSR